mmetsp:Transcript_39016/g.110226  ORF Transcript_39016/g.110226 Transcript_39016/m.110226 type:complete len:84 (+) Transcript_39016:1353-1604(+)
MSRSISVLFLNSWSNCFPSMLRLTISPCNARSSCPWTLHCAKDEHHSDVLRGDIDRTDILGLAHKDDPQRTSVDDLGDGIFWP